MLPKHLIAALALLAAASADADARLLIGDRWPLLAFERDQGCELAVTSSGKTMQIRAGGLIPGEAVRMSIANGDMKPVAVTLFADGTGQLVRYYIPFRFNREGGTVGIELGAARCSLAATAPWTRTLATIP